MEKINNKVTIAAHNGNFHADDIFAVAALSLLLEQRSKTENKDVGIEIIRTRDVEKINQADYVVDVGGVYDESINRFDHHQSGGAGKRDNGIPYSSIGLVWKKYGEELVGSKEVADQIDTIIVQPIDAGDNGVDISKDIHSDIKPFRIQDIVRAFKATWKEDDEQLEINFKYLVNFAKEVIDKQINSLKDTLEAIIVIREIYNNTEDKRLIILDKHYPFEIATSDMDDVLLVVYPDRGDIKWCLECLEVEVGKFNQKILLPESWAGKSNEELEKVTGVPGSIFCHNRRFFAVAKTKEAAIALAQITLNQ